MSKTKNPVELLKDKYQDIMEAKGNNPEWAVHNWKSMDELVSCTIPFVGKEYIKQQIKILVYASAENLSWYKYEDGHNIDWLEDREKAVDRHRLWFEYKEVQNDSFFPNVHIQPMNNGCLSTAVYYIANKLKPVRKMKPRDFYETIAFANYGKYSIETEKQRSIRTKETDVKGNANKDYAGKMSFLSESHEFITADIETLVPDYIIMPASIYKTDKEFVDKIKGNAQIIPIYQMNAGVINRIIAANFDKCTEKALAPNVRLWYAFLGRDGMSGKSKENYRAVFSYLDSIM